VHTDSAIHVSRAAVRPARRSLARVVPHQLSPAAEELLVLGRSDAPAHQRTKDGLLLGCAARQVSRRFLDLREEEAAMSDRFVQLCGCAAVRLCGCAAVRLCGCAA